MVELGRSSSEQAAITQQEEAGWRTASQEEAEKEKERRPKRQKHKEDEKEKEQEKKKLQLPLLPGHLKDKHLNMYTVGCKGDYTTGSILDSYGVPKRKTLLVDCRYLEGARNNVQGHYGASTRVIKNIMKLDMGHLEVMFQEISKALCEDPHLDSLVFFCDYGKHRCVGAEKLTSNAMRRVSIVDTHGCASRTQLPPQAGKEHAGTAALGRLRTSAPA